MSLVLSIVLILAAGSPPPERASEGRATWYATPGLTAAAGPALRHALGRGWRGSWVRVTSGRRSVVVKLTDWCACFRGDRRERLIDLSDGAFSRLAPLSAGIVRVTVVPLTPPATDAR